MEQKKSEKADLENKKAIFFQIGLVFVLGLTLLAFEWKSYDKTIVDTSSRQAAAVLEEVVLQTQQNAPPPPPPPPQQQTTVLEIVENDAKIENEVSINAESDQKTIVEEYKAPTVVAEKEVVETEIFTVVEDNPAFPGGDEARIQFLQSNMKYPTMARESGIQGKVYVTFVVEKDGRVTDVKILRGIGGGCDEEAVRVVKAMPKWTPGKQRGKAVRVQFNLPIQFTLNG